MHICIFGLGYVGITSMACLAAMGHRISGVDVAETKVDMLSHGISPIFEPGISELLSRHRDKITATTDPFEGLRDADAVLICVGTPSNMHGAIEDTHLLTVAREIARSRRRLGRVIPVFVRSTALPEIHGRVREILASESGQPPAYCVHPEFLRAGQAVHDFQNPPKIIFGCDEPELVSVAKELYTGLTMPSTFTDTVTAALVKYADNCFHAVKVTFTNELSMLAKANGGDARKIMDLVCADTKLNISPSYMRPGFAFGGSCLPKDLRAALAWCRQNMVSLPMLEHVLPSNQLQIDRTLSRILATGAKSVALFGLSFKANTDDLRESPLVNIAETLLGKGKAVHVYDPLVQIERMVGKNLHFALEALPHLRELLVVDPVQAVEQSEVAIIARSFPGLSWEELPWRPDHLVLDFDGNQQLGTLSATIEGLYWPADESTNSESTS